MREGGQGMFFSGHCLVIFETFIFCPFLGAQISENGKNSQTLEFSIPKGERDGGSGDLDGNIFRSLTPVLGVRGDVDLSRGSFLCEN